MESDPSTPAAAGATARFSPGDLIQHNRFGYRGVIVDVDATFSLSESWYDQVARSRPPKDRPWYHVLVDGSDGSDGSRYVAERHLEPDESGAPIRHPLLDRFFDTFEAGRYRRTRPLN